MTGGRIPWNEPGHIRKIEKKIEREAGGLPARCLLRGYNMGTLGQVLWVTAAAGIGGTGLGGGAACLFRRDSSRTVSLLLSFAAGIMVAVVCFDLLAEAAPGRMAVTALGILSGYGVTAGLNHALERKDRTEGRSSLLLAGLVMAAAIALHNVPEGMVIGAAFAGGNSGWLMAAVIALHNIPEGMAVSVPMAAGGERRWKAAATAALTGAPTVLGAALGYIVGTLSPAALAVVLSLASGAMLYVVFAELLPEATGLWKSRLPALAAVLGIIVGMAITLGHG